MCPFDPNELFDLISQRMNENKSFHTKEYNALSLNDKIVENLLNVGYFIVNKRKIKNVIGFECDFVNENDYPLRAILADGSIINLDLDYDISYADYEMQERVNESADMIDKSDRLYVSKTIMDKSKEHYSGKEEPTVIEEEDDLEPSGGSHGGGISPSEVFRYLRGMGFKGGSVHTDEHEALDDEDKVVEDYLELAKYCAKYMKIRNVSYVQITEVNSFNPGYFVLDDGSKVEFDIDSCVRHNDQDLSERRCEIDCLYPLDEDYIKEKVMETSKELFSNK